MLLNGMSFGFNGLWNDIGKWCTNFQIACCLNCTLNWFNSSSLKIMMDGGEIVDE